MLPIPPCALCGASLSRARERVLLTFARSGSPTIGWHAACAEQDLVYRRHVAVLRDSATSDASATLEAVLERGAARVSAGKRFWRERVLDGCDPERADACSERSGTCSECTACGCATVHCDYCPEVCVDFRFRGGKRMCVLCLSSRLDSDHQTLDGITAACVAGGYDVDGEDDEATWIARQLAELSQARADARALAHAYEHDSRPPGEVVARCLLLPVGDRGAR